jgi:uncharacterized protein YbbC (DUF1343 family)
MRIVNTLSAVTLLVTAAASGAPVRTGIDVLMDNNFRILSGKRVGLITNPTGITR